MAFLRHFCLISVKSDRTIGFGLKSYHNKVPLVRPFSYYLCPENPDFLQNRTLFKMQFAAFAKTRPTWDWYQKKRLDSKFLWSEGQLGRSGVLGVMKQRVRGIFKQDSSCVCWLCVRFPRILLLVVKILGNLTQSQHTQEESYLKMPLTLCFITPKTPLLLSCPSNHRNFESSRFFWYQFRCWKRWVKAANCSLKMVQFWRKSGFSGQR